MSAPVLEPPLLLFAAIIILALGPVLYHLVARAPPLLMALDGLVLAGVLGLVLFQVLPEAVREAGPVALALAGLGLLLPTVLEKLQSTSRPGTERATYFMIALGLLVHESLDGAALAAAKPVPLGGPLALAVLLHRLPIGALVWRLVHPQFGTLKAILVLGLVAASTMVGFVLGPELITFFAGAKAGLFSAFAGGALLHVLVVHRPRARRWRLP